MLIQLIVSMFGIAFVHRNLSLLEKIDVLSRSKLNLVFYFLQLPFYFYLIFKELLPAILIYIGLQERYHKDGRKMAFGTFENGNGELKHFDDNGTLETIEYFKVGKKIKTEIIKKNGLTKFNQ